jgi:hypothetical protein
MVTMLLLAFLGSQLNLLGSFVSILAGLALSPFFGGPPRIAQGITLFILAILLVLCGFLSISLYPEHGRRQFMLGVLALIAWPIWFISTYRLFDFLSSIIRQRYTWAIGVDTIVASLTWEIGSAAIVGWLVGNRVKSRSDLTVLIFGLLIGIGIRSIFHYENFDLSPISLSGVLFLELLSRRASWRIALTGALLWIGLMVSSFYLTDMFHKILF